MRVWVTGGAGFVGSHICDRLLIEGHQVDAIDDMSSGDLSNLSGARRHGDFTFHQIDVRRPELVDLARRQRPEAIIHAAGYLERPGSLHSPREDTDVNIGSLLAVLAAARDVNARRVVAVVHATPDTTDPPHTPAEVNAWTVVDHLRIHQEQGWLDTVAAVVSNVYGPRQMVDDQGPLVARMVRQATLGLPLPVQGSGEQVRDLVYVDDAVSAIVSCLAAEPGSVIPVGSGTTISVNEVAEAVAAACGRDLDLVYEPARMPDVNRLAWPTGVAMSLLRWAAWTDFEDGLSDVVADWHGRLLKRPEV
ncbi:MAG: UDP-glucose 4-epimerase [Candidatus Poriferisodalaceae bacterium]|jgi:UDP-glucose 4-epimerase